MSQHPEEIRQEMDETRNSLTDKISMLEDKVVETVQDASAGVKETVEAVKDAVQETVQTMKETVGDTVDSVKETFSISCQVKHHPWMIMAGSVGVGFAAGYLLNAPPAASAKTPSSSSPPRRRTGNGTHREHFLGNGGEQAASSSSGASSSDTTGRIGQLAGMFEEELNQLKGLAIGTLAGVVRDMVVKVVPEIVRSPLTDIINDFTKKFGGHPIEGKIFGDQEGRGEGDEQSERSSSGSSQSDSFHNRQTMTFPTN